MGKIKTGITLLLLLTLSLAVMPVKILTTHALVFASIQGYIIDKSYEAYTQRIMTTGKVYALEVNTKVNTSVDVNATDGSYKLTDLQPGTYQLTASAGLYPNTGYAYANTTLPYKITVEQGTNLTNINIPLNRGCKLEGYLRYIDAGTSQPIRAIAGNAWLRAAGITLLNYSVEAYDLNGRSMGTYNSSFRYLSAQDATTSPFTITGLKYAGLEAGTYQLKPWVFGYINKTSTVVTATTSGSTVSSISINVYSGGIISGTIAFVDPMGSPETPKTASDKAGAIYGGNVSINIFDSNGALRGVFIHKWIPADDLATTLRFYVLGFSEYYNKTYTGRAYKDYGLADGVYTVRVNIRGYLQKTTGTVIISQGGNSTIRVTMTRGGAIITTIYSMSGDAHLPWQYPSYVLRVSVYGMGLIDVDIQNSSVDRFVMRFCGLDYSVSNLQSGYLPYGLFDGTYKLTLFTYGYVQPTEVYATILTGSKTDAIILAQLGCKISGRVIFKTQDVSTPVSEDVSSWVGVFDASGALKGYFGAFLAPTGSSHCAFSISGSQWFPEYGLDTGTYTMKLMDCYGPGSNSALATVRYMQVANVTVTLAKLGDIAYVEITAHEMGRVYGFVKAYGTLGQLVPLSGVLAHTSTREGAVIEYTSGADGNYSLNLPVNRTNVNQPIKYNVTFGKYYFINQTIPVETYSGAKTPRDVVLVVVPEFPTGPTIILTLAYGLISLLLYRIKKGAKQAKISRKKEPT